MSKMQLVCKKCGTVWEYDPKKPYIPKDVDPSKKEVYCPHCNAAYGVWAKGNR